MIILLNKINNFSFELVEIYFIVVLLIDLFIIYLLNYYLNFYESGIVIFIFLFFKKIIFYD